MLFPSEKVFSVTELNSIIKEILEGTFPTIRLEGEISGLKTQSSGHIYFSLKDSSSLVSAVMFRGSAQHLSFIPKDGMKVQVSGKLSVYPPQGRYQLIVSKMSLAGEGEILKMLEERKRKLYAEGIFDEERKRNLPLFPKTIGIVTSPTGAALRDILQITKRRNPGISVVIFPSMVQGDEAARTIVQQIKNANAAKLCDVLIVGRGGGSLEDLLPFSEEEVVRAIAESEIPVVSAVGHEIDWALSDYAADKRAPTPSAAAELVVPQKSDILNEIRHAQEELSVTIRSKIEKIRLILKGFEPEGLELKFRSIEQPLLQRFDNAKENLIENMNLKVKDTRLVVENCISFLESASPKAIFDRGYSMVREKDSGTIIRKSSQVKKGSLIEIFPSQGRIEALVSETEKQE